MARGHEPLGESELAIWHAWKHAGDAVMVGVERALQAEAGVSGADFGVLSRLVDLGEGTLPQLQLQGSLRWDKSRLSHQLTRMEERGLLERRRSGKLVDARITRKGRSTLSAARGAHAAAVRRCLLDAIGEGERAACLRLLERLSEASGRA